MNRLAGIIVAVTGLLIAVLSAVKVIPGITATGVFLFLLGGLIFGLSFVPPPDSEGVERKSTAETLLGIFYAPGEIFRNLRFHPRWFAAVLIMSIMSGVYTNLFMVRLTAEKVTNYSIDKTLQMSFLNDAAKAQIEASRPQAIADQKDPFLRTAQAVGKFVGLVFLMAFLGALFFLVVLAFGGKMNYWQAFSAVVYAAFPVAVIKFALNTLLLYLKDPDDIHPILGQNSLIQDSPNFLVLPSEHPVIFVLLSAFGLLVIYNVWLSAIGLKNAGEKVPASTAWTAALSVWFLIYIAFSAILALIFPSFFS